MSGFRVYLLDYDGTLAATRPAAAACLTRTLQERGARLPAASIEAEIASGAPLERVFARLLPGATSADVDDCVQRYRTLYADVDREMTVLFGGVRETLARLHADGRSIVVISNKGRAALEAALVRFELADTISAVLAADPGAPVKPDPQAFHRRVRPLFADLAAPDFVMVGDTAADIAFARAAGIAVCWAAYGYGDAERCLAMRPDFVVQALPELLSPRIDPTGTGVAAGGDAHPDG